MRLLAPSLCPQLFCLLLLGVTAPTLAADRVVLVAGGGESRDEGPADKVKLSAPFGVAFTPKDELIFVEMTGQRIGRIDAHGKLTWFGGTGKKAYSGDGGPALAAEFNGIHNLAIAPSGDIYLSDTWNSVVRRIDGRTGVVSTIAGTGAKGFSGDGGPAVKAQVGNVYCVSLDPAGEQLYLADLDNRRIRAVDLASGTIRTVAGIGKTGRPDDGADAAASPLVDPRAVIADAAGNVYILERGGHALRVVDKQGRIRTVVGTGKKGNTGDGGPALAATLNGPKHLGLDRDGSVLICDTENHCLRRFDPKSGLITRVAGTGKKGATGLDGPPLDLELNQPHGIFLHASGDLYLSDSSNDRILKIERAQASTR